MGKKVQHASDCAVHNAPAYPAGPCDCGAEVAANQTVMEIVAAYLQANGYDGLWLDDVCGCFVDDLAPCGEINGECRAGHKITLEDGEEGIGPKE